MTIQTHTHPRTPYNSKGIFQMQDTTPKATQHTTPKATQHTSHKRNENRIGTTHRYKLKWSKMARNQWARKKTRTPFQARRQLKTNQ